MRRFLTVSLVFCCAFAAMSWVSAPAMAAESAATPVLVIKVGNVSAAKGSIHYAVYDRPESFPGRDGRLRKGQVPATAPVTEIRLSDLKPGVYAVAVYHDENSNGEFDQGLFSLPLEDYGFSNDARGFLSAPSFEAARFSLGPETTTISITLGR